MANEGLLKFDWPDTGISTFTASILDSDSAERQGSIAFSDSGHLGRYTNTTSIPTIVAGDSVKVYLAGNWVATNVYQPEVTVDNVADCKADVSNLDVAVSSRATAAKQDSMETTLDTVVPSTPANVEHSTEQIIRQAASTLTVGGTVTRTSEPEVIA